VTPVDPGTGAPDQHRRRGRRTASLLGLAVLVAGSVTFLGPAGAASFATETSGPGVDPDPSPESGVRVQALLDRVASAAETVAYKGSHFVSAWDGGTVVTSIAEVVNVPGQGVAVRTRAGRDGTSGSVFATPAEEALQLGGGPVDLLARNYSVRRAGNDTVAGRSVRVLEMLGEGRALAARLWVDRQTGLLLRREVYDDQGQTIRASAFFDIRIKQRSTPGHLPPMLPVTPAQDLGRRDLAELRASGCSCPQWIAEHLELYQARAIDRGDGTTVLHLSYSDGLSTVSVFEQAGSVDRTAMAGYREVRDEAGRRFVRDGVPHQVVWSADGVVYAVVADAPGSMVDAVLTALPQEVPDSDGVVDRVGRGLARVGSWVNPFA
jgi:sigma-E factor negative regulatory protein RseB